MAEYIPRHILVELTTRATLAIHTNLAAIVAVSKVTNNTAYYPEFTRYIKRPWIWRQSHNPVLRLLSPIRSKVQGANTDENLFDFVGASMLTYPEWLWNNLSMRFYRVNPDLLTPELRAASQLAQAQCIMMDWLMSNISYTRAKLLNGVDFQDLVYLEKKRQALALRDADYDVSRAIDVPYVTEYAAFANISLERAAQDIILQAQLADDYLLKTELLRQTFFTKVLTAKKANEMQAIMDEFIRATSRDSLA